MPANPTALSACWVQKASSARTYVKRNRRVAASRVAGIASAMSLRSNDGWVNIHNATSTGSPSSRCQHRMARFSPITGRIGGWGFNRS